MMARPKNAVLWIALTVTLAASAWALFSGDEASDTATKPRRGTRNEARSEVRSGVRANSAPAEAALPVPDAAAMTRGEFAAQSGNLFASRTLQPPPPPPPPPPKPVAPPLPFKFLGHLAEGDSTVVFLDKSQRTLLAKQGDTLEGVYLVESIAATSMTFLYKPLNERQTLSFGNLK